MLDCLDTVLVIACGDPSREDDGVAWRVLEGLRTLRPRPDTTALHLRHARQLAPEMAECVSRARGVVFVEARRQGTPGQIRCDAVEPAPGANPLDQILRPEGLLLYAQALYGRAPKAVTVGITGERFGAGAELSPRASHAVRWGVRAVLRQARVWSAVPSVTASEATH